MPSCNGNRRPLAKTKVNLKKCLVLNKREFRSPDKCCSQGFLTSFRAVLSAHALDGRDICGGTSKPAGTRTASDAPRGGNFPGATRDRVAIDSRTFVP